MADRRDDEEIQPLLQAVELDESLLSPNREQIRAETLATFDAVTSKDWDITPGSSQVGSRAEILTVPAPNRLHTSNAGRLLAWAAAAIVIAVVGLAFAAIRSPYETAEPGQPTEAGQVRSLVDHSIELPAPLEAGRQATDAIAAGLEFDAPQGLFVLEESQGLIVIADAEISTERTGQIVIVELQWVDLEADLRSLEGDRTIDIEQATASSGGPTTQRWDLTIQSDAARELGCAAGDPCLHLPGQATGEPPLLWAGAENRVTELGRSPSLVVVAIEQSLRLSGPISRQSMQLLDSAELTLK